MAVVVLDGLAFFFSVFGVVFGFFKEKGCVWFVFLVSCFLFLLILIKRGDFGFRLNWNFYLFLFKNGFCEGRFKYNKIY